jgi:hypothetical protein
MKPGESGAAYGHVDDAPATNIADMGRVPLLGAFGFKGATALTTTGPDSKAVQSTTNGLAVNVYVYCTGGGANRPIDQLTASGVTVVGEEEKVPVAANSICAPFAVLLIVMDWSCRPSLPQVRLDTPTNSRKSRARNRIIAAFLSVHHTTGSMKRVRLCRSRGKIGGLGQTRHRESMVPRLA